MTAQIALYPGSFDPIHLGHVDVIERVSRLFDRVVVAVFVNAAKAPWFSAEERVAMAREATRHLPNVRVDQSDDLLVRYAAGAGVGVVVRGLRAVLDFDYEFQTALMNKRLAPRLETLFILTSERYSYLSSTIVKELARYNADLDGLVPDDVKGRLRERARALAETP